MMRLGRIRCGGAERHDSDKISALPQPGRNDYDRPQLHHLRGDETGAVIAKNNFAGRGIIAECHTSRGRRTTGAFAATPQAYWGGGRSAGIARGLTRKFSNYTDRAAPTMPLRIIAALAFLQAHRRLFDEHVHWKEAFYRTLRTLKHIAHAPETLGKSNWPNRKQGGSEYFQPSPE